MKPARHQVLGAAQLALGLALLARPETVLAELAGPRAQPARRIARVLGSRLSVQGSAVALSGNPLVVDGGGAV
ncbi:MAG TPA: hypothetical protein VHO01_11055, partial [Jatrophihabitans sp.]|nr:hypothetical protein [Jatrophihabitans sp.]